MLNGQARLWPIFGNITPNCKSASASSLKVSPASELLLTRSWHHRGSGVTPPSHLSNEYFDKFVRWRERHINLSDHNLRDKAFKFGVGELRTTLCTCRPLDHFTCEPLCQLVSTCITCITCTTCITCVTGFTLPPGHLVTCSVNSAHPPRHWLLRQELFMLQPLKMLKYIFVLTAQNNPTHHTKLEKSGNERIWNKVAALLD